MKIYHALYDSYGATLHIEASSPWVARILAAKRMGVPQSHRCLIAIVDPDAAGGADYLARKAKLASWMPTPDETNFIEAHEELHRRVFNVWRGPSIIEALKSDERCQGCTPAFGPGALDLQDALRCATNRFKPSGKVMQGITHWDEFVAVRNGRSE